MSIARRDWSDWTPPFQLTAEQVERLHELHASHFDYALADMHRAHCYRHRPVAGVTDSLTPRGDLLFRADWEANAAQHMLEAKAAYATAARPALRKVA